MVCIQNHVPDQNTGSSLRDNLATQMLKLRYGEKSGRNMKKRTTVYLSSFAVVFQLVGSNLMYKKYSSPLLNLVSNGQ